MSVNKGQLPPWWLNIYSPVWTECAVEQNLKYKVRWNSGIGFCYPLKSLFIWNANLRYLFKNNLFLQMFFVLFLNCWETSSLHSGLYGYPKMTFRKPMIWFQILTVYPDSYMCTSVLHMPTTFQFPPESPPNALWKNLKFKTNWPDVKGKWLLAHLYRFPIYFALSRSIFPTCVSSMGNLKCFLRVLGIWILFLWIIEYSTGHGHSQNHIAAFIQKPEMKLFSLP